MRNKKNINSFKKILNSSMTTKEDLEYLVVLYNLGVVRIVWQKDADPDYQGMQIINLGNPNIGGSHWVATYKGKYFDSFGVIPPVKFENLEYKPFMIQNPDYGHCGQYVILWLYYLKHNEEDKFYNLFSEYVHL